MTKAIKTKLERAEAIIREKQRMLADAVASEYPPGTEVWAACGKTFHKSKVMHVCVGPYAGTLRVVAPRCQDTILVHYKDLRKIKDKPCQSTTPATPTQS